MDLIQLKIKNDHSIIKYIKIMRKFDSSLSVGTIKKRIEDNDFVIAFDLEYYDVVEDINGIDKKELFDNMINELSQAGAEIDIYQNEELITLEVFHNWLESLKQTSQQIECDRDRELNSH